MTRFNCSTFLTGLFTLFIMALALPAQAHRVNIFAWPDNGSIEVECKFSGGTPARQAAVTARDTVTGAVVLSGKTDDRGRLSLPAGAGIIATAHPLELTVNAGEGHQNHWRFTAEDIAALQAPADTEVSTRSEALTPVAAGKPASEQTLTVTPAQLERIVNGALSRQLAPIRQQLAELSNPEPGLRDIVGGLGWLIGLAGLAAFFSRRKR